MHKFDTAAYRFRKMVITAFSHGMNWIENSSKNINNDDFDKANLGSPILKNSTIQINLILILF